MPQYTMPDGNAYEFKDDAEATRAMQAWSKQFGDGESKLGSALSAGGRTVLGMVGAIPQAIRGLGELGVGLATGDQARIERPFDFAESSNPAQMLPEGGKLTQEYQQAIGEGFDRFTEGVGRAWNEVSGDPRSRQKAKFDKNNKDELATSLAEENATRFTGELLSNLLPIGIGAKAARGKPKAKNQEVAANLEALARRKAEEEVSSPSKQLEGATIPYAEFETNLQAAKRAREMQEQARNTAIPLPDKFSDPTLPVIDPNLIVRGAEREQPLPNIVDPDVLSQQKALQGEPAPLRDPLLETPPHENMQQRGGGELQGPPPRPLANVGLQEGAMPSARPVESLAMRHDVPTIDFPLKTEHLTGDAMAQLVLRELDQRRWEVSQMEVEKAKGGKKAAEIAEAQRKTEARIAELEQIAKDNGWTGWQQGSKGLFGFGKPTLAPIEKTNPLAGFGKKQRGSFSLKKTDPSLLDRLKDVGFHFGDKGIARDTLNKNMTLGRGTGHFGTGVYFFGDSNTKHSRGDRPLHEIPLEGKKLLKPSDPKQLHEGLRLINDLSRISSKLDFEEILNPARKAAWYLTLNLDYGFSRKNEINRAIRSVLEDERKNPRRSELSPSTRVLQKLGYDGVDVRGTKYDNGEFGSVLYPDKVHPIRLPMNQRGSVEGMGNSFLLKAFDRFTKKAEAPESQHGKNVDLAQATKALPDSVAQVYNGIDVPPSDVPSFIQYAKDFISNIKNDLTGFELRKALTVSPGANLIAAGTKNPVIRWGYHQVDQAYKNAENNIATFVQPQSKALQKLSEADRNLFYTAVRVAEGKFDWTKEELVGAGIPDHIADIIEGLQVAGKRQWELANEALVATGSKPVPYRPGHFSSTFIGSFRTLVKDKTTGKVKYVLSHNSRWMHDKATKALQEKFNPNDFTYEKLPYERNPHQFSRDADAGFRILLETLATDDPITKAISDAYGNWKATTAETYLGQHQHFKGKSKEAVGGAEGLKYEKEFTQNAIDGVKAHIRFLENGFLWSEMDKANAAVGKMLADTQLESKLPNTAKYVREYMEQAKGWRRNTLGKLSDLISDTLASEFMGKLGVGKNALPHASQLIRSVINKKLLDGPNFTFLAMQWLQIANTLPEARSLSKILKSPDMAINKMVEGYEKITFSNDPFWIEVSNWARDKKISASAIDIDTADIGAMKGMHTFDKVWSGPRRWSEEQTRAITFGGFVNILKDHYPKDKVLQIAADATERALGDYRNFERAMMFESGGWIGKNMGFLMTYMMNAFGQLSRFYKNKDFNNLATLFGILTFSSGLISVIGAQQMEVIRDVWNYMFAAKTGNVLPSPKEVLLKNAPDWLTFGGTSTITGAAVSERMGFGQIAPQGISDLLMRGSSDLIKTGASFADVVTNPTSSTAWKKFALDAAPNSLKSIPEKMFYTSDKGEVISPTKNQKTGYTRTDADQVYRWLNVKSLAEAKHNIKEWEITLKENELREFRGKLLDRWEKSFFETDNKLKKGSVTSDAADIYRKLGGKPEDFIKEAKKRAINRQLTPEQRAYMGNNPYQIQRRMEWNTTNN